MPLKLVRYPRRSQHYYLRGTVRGVSVFETTGTDQLQAAEAIRIQREGELLHESVFGQIASVSFAEAAVSYLSEGGEKRFLGQFDERTGKWTLLIGHFGQKAAALIGQADADRAAAAICPNAGPATRKRHVYGPLCAVLNHAARNGWCPRPSIRHPRVKMAPVKWATPEWVETLLPHCAPSLRRFVIIGVYTGARLSEVLRLSWADVDLVHRTLLFRRTKNGKMRTAPMADPVLIELAAMAERERAGRLFHWADKCHVYGPLKTACRRAGLPYLSPHQFGRHTYATWLRIYAKRDLRGLMDDGGWDSLASVQRYAHTVPGETAAAVAQLPIVQNPCSSGEGSLKDRKTRKKSA